MNLFHNLTTGISKGEREGLGSLSITWIFESKLRQVVIKATASFGSFMAHLRLVRADKLLDAGNSPGNKIEIVTDPDPLHSFRDRWIVDSVGCILSAPLDPFTVQSKARVTRERDMWPTCERQSRGGSDCQSGNERFSSFSS